MPKIHGVMLSPFVRKVRIALEEKGIDYELVPVVPFGLSEDFKKISPARKIPVYEDDDGFTVPDSSVILAYLERIHPAIPLYPADPRQYASALFVEEYSDTKLSEACNPVFFERYVAARFFKREPDPAVIEHCAEQLQPPAFDYLQSVVAGRPFAVGDRFSIADIALVSPLIQLLHVEAPLDAQRWPQLAAYLEGILARPSYKALLDEERAALG